MHELGTKEIARRYAVAMITVRRWCEMGLLPGARKEGVGKRATWLIPATALEGFTPPRERQHKERPATV